MSAPVPARTSSPSRRFAKRLPQPPRERFAPRDWFKNTIHYEAEHRALVDIVGGLQIPTPTREVADAAGLPFAEALGALKMLELQERCFSTSGGRSQLLWSRGKRPESMRQPKLVARAIPHYQHVVSTLRYHSGDCISTDGLMRAAEIPQGHRKAIRGGLKALVALGLVRWENHSQQAIAWQWIGPRGKGNRFVLEGREGTDDLGVITDQMQYEAWLAAD